MEILPAAVGSLSVMTKPFVWVWRRLRGRPAPEAERTVNVQADHGSSAAGVGAVQARDNAQVNIAGGDMHIHQGPTDPAEIARLVAEVWVHLILEQLTQGAGAPPSRRGFTLDPPPRAFVFSLDAYGRVAVQPNNLQGGSALIADIERTPGPDATIVVLQNRRETGLLVSASSTGIVEDTTGTLAMVRGDTLSVEMRSEGRVVSVGELTIDDWP